MKGHHSVLYQLLSVLISDKFQADTDYYKHKIHLIKWLYSVKIRKSITIIWFKYKQKLIKLSQSQMSLTLGLTLY